MFGEIGYNKLKLKVKKSKIKIIIKVKKIAICHSELAKNPIAIFLNNEILHYIHGDTICVNF